jgi:hypothetical protein
MSKQTLFRQQRNIEALHKIAAYVQGGRENKFNYLKAHRFGLERPVRGFSTKRGMSRFQIHDYRTLLRRSNQAH